ncbi:hypothetical protein CHS0354_019557, partial [Potamilus streckersoni]
NISYLPFLAVKPCSSYPRIPSPIERAMSDCPFQEYTNSNHSSRLTSSVFQLDRTIGYQFTKLIVCPMTGMKT